MKKNESFDDKLYRITMVVFCVCMVCLSAFMLMFVLSKQAKASQDAPNDLYAMQCVEGTCYYATGKKIPKETLAKFEKHLADEMAKIEKEEGAASDQ